MCVSTGTATIYARYKFVERLNEDLVNAKPLLNKCALWFGMTSCVGMCIVATFQVSLHLFGTLTPAPWVLTHSGFSLLQETAVTYVHDFGALVFFISGVGYIILQTRISYFIYPLGSTASMCRARVAITIIAALAVFPSILKSAIKQRKSRDCTLPVYYRSQKFVTLKLKTQP